MTPLIDQFGRVHDNLRVSVTDRCNLRCFYCMPLENVQYLPRPELLKFEEICRFVEIMVRNCGVSKIRLTGGEPLVRQSLESLIEKLLQIPGLDDLSLTTNGILLNDQADTLFAAGLRRLNISLDTLDPQRFQQIARREALDKVLAGITAAQNAGFEPIKLNAVAIRGLTEHDLCAFARMSRQTGVQVRFIEYMPLDAERNWEREKVLSEQEMMDILQNEFGDLKPVPGNSESSPARDYQFADGLGRIGFISSVTRPFCAHCNRFRLTSDGKIRNCLFSQEETDVRSLLRSGAEETEIVAVVRQSILNKAEGHEINSAKFLQPLRPMHSIGG
ncbi:MAG: GTP 3',8-cyclase MoaA [Planctomycetaceae bacterium]|nr:GTP 3',8-cyclase MoaA [Planctomycetaceae bacterium]